jgi:hypothetical protein
LKREVQGIHGTISYESNEPRWRRHIAPTKREIDTDPQAVNEAQRQLFASKRHSP